MKSSTVPLLTRIAISAVHGAHTDWSDMTPASPAWQGFLEDAEASHLAPLAAKYLKEARHCVPPDVTRKLTLLSLRHESWHKERTRALDDILSALERAGIDTVVLKGAALAWTVYPSPSLRPMSDVDILVAPSAARPAQAVLHTLGFQSIHGLTIPARRSHHLPVMARTLGGLPIHVEIHVDALSPDTCASLSLANLSEPLQTFGFGGRTANALGHVDALRHLVHHLLEPTVDGRVRLIGVVDLLRYAKVFDDHIDWPRLERDFRLVVNAIRCVHTVVPVPPPLARFASETIDDRSGAGKMMRPLRCIVASGRPLIDVVRELFSPPAWWLHAYYGVPMGRSLVRVRLLDHPLRLTRWAALRVRPD